MRVAKPVFLPSQLGRSQKESVRIKQPEYTADTAETYRRELTPKYLGPYTCYIARSGPLEVGGGARIVGILLFVSLLKQLDESIQGTYKILAAGTSRYLHGASAMQWAYTYT